jgi:hypothetical protein
MPAMSTTGPNLRNRRSIARSSNSSESTTQAMSHVDDADSVSAKGEVAPVP